MSNFFSNKNQSEYGPGPSDEVSWLVIENQVDLQHESRYCVVQANERNEAMTNPCHLCKSSPKVWKCTACKRTRVRRTKLRVVR
jgi:ribosomal protein L37AE/L43A